MPLLLNRLFAVVLLSFELAVLVLSDPQQMISWKTIADASRRVIPPLSFSAHKGQMG